MKLKDILKNTGIRIKKTDIDIKGITNDSRKVKKDYLFFAYKGEEDDGKKYINDAIKKGAKIIISDEKIKNNSVITIKVNDMHKTMSIISKNFYKNPSSKLFTIGITGTKGKTTTSYLIQHILNKTNNKTGIIGTIAYKTHKKIISQSPNTTPLSIYLNMYLDMMIKDGDKNVVMEVSSHALELKRVDDIEFDVAIFTNFQSDHLDFHKTIDNYAKAKIKLFELLNKSSKTEKHAIINIDDKFSNRIINMLDKKIKIITYAIKKDADIKAQDIKLYKDKTIFNIKDGNQKIKIISPLCGKYNIYNLLAAISVLKIKKINIKYKYLNKIIKNFKGVPGRLERIKFKDFTAYVDYAHTEESLRQVLLTIKQIPHNKIITIFGCGGDRDPSKRAPMGNIASKLSDFVIVTTDNPRTENPQKIIDDIVKGIKKKNYITIIDREKAIEEAIKIAEKGDIILIAGKGHENYQIVGNKKIYFSDKNVLLKYRKKYYGS